MYFLVPRASDLFGPRIFVIDPGLVIMGEGDKLVDVGPAHRFLQSLCLFGGSDKKLPSSVGEWWGYQLTDERFELARLVLLKMGKPIERKVALA